MSTNTTGVNAALKKAFHRTADERFARVTASGKTVGWDDARRYLEARARGIRLRKPSARELAR